MVTPCQTLAVPIQAKFEVTAFTISNANCPAPCTTCAEPCSVDAIITWKNTGGVSGQFEPAIKINDIRTGSGTTRTLPPNQEYTETFTLTNLPASGSPYTICPDPNP